MAHKAKMGESLSDRERFCIDAVLFNSDNNRSRLYPKP